MSIKSTPIEKCEVCGHLLMNGLAGGCYYCEAVDVITAALRVAAWNFRRNTGEEVRTVMFIYDPDPSGTLIDVSFTMADRFPTEGSS